MVALPVRKRSNPNRMKESYLDQLNEVQRKAVTHSQGPIMIIAGAGSGKTRVLTYRMAHLLAQGVEPYNILALTFTNKAAKEMRNRIEALVGTPARSLWMGTFHSVFAKILRTEAPRINYPSNFTIYDTDDSKSLIKSILKEMGLDDKTYKPNQVLSRISSAKNRLIGWEQYARDAELVMEDEASGRPQTAKIYQMYQTRAFRSGAMDFDDLLFNTNILFRDHLDVLNKYQQKFHYVLVDEYQDTNLSQYLIARKLAAVRRNICVVGDDAQSIYAFRGADIQNILNFEKDYPDAEIFRLEQNYRSTQNIVEVANSVIKHNKGQLKKNVWTSNDQGEFIDLIKAESDNDEARLVAQSIFEEKVKSSSKNKDFAILYRTNAQSRPLEEALRKLNLRYRIIGGLSFYERKEVKDLMAYLRLAVNPQDEEAFKRVINYPKRGIGDTTIAKLMVAASDNGVSPWEILPHARAVLQGKALGEIDSFVNLIKSFGIMAQAKNAFEVVDHVSKASGIIRELTADKTVEGIGRYENIQSLLSGVQQFVNDPEAQDKSLTAWLQDVALLTDEDRNKNEDDSITLMTIHSSKGLEFKNVFIVGLEEELFPSMMMVGSREDLEEERRLFYVAVTRAEKKLTLSYAVSRFRFGSLRMMEPSRFLAEVDTRYLNMARKFEVEAQPNFRFADQFKRPAKSAPAQPQVAAHTPSAHFSPSPLTALKAGVRVEHQKFGFGTVQNLDVTSPDKKATILFDKNGEKTLILSFAKLMVVD
jgi:DNA helicase-2/ATP-dependent DNA helicase PcrA